MDIEYLLQQFEGDKNAYSSLFSSFEEKEKFIENEIIDTAKKIAKSQITDQTLMTSLIRRTNYVMSKLPSGTVRVLSKKDRGKGALLNLILANYILPNANAQADAYTKFWLVEFLSLIYGKVDVLVDWVIRDGYTGSDFFIIPPKLGFPEPGVISVDDAQRYTIVSYVSEQFLKSRKGLKSWKNIDKVLEAGTKNKALDYETSTQRERENPDLYQNQYELITVYFPHRWVSFSRQARVIVRDIENPHHNGKLPIVSKVCYPLLDSYFGMSEYDRNISQQKALNSIINLSLDSLKKHLFPPTKIYPHDVHMPSFSLSPGAVWVLKTPNPNAITQEQFSPAPLHTFNALYGVMKGALLSSLGTTDTVMSSSIEPSLGKTPEALRMQQVIMSNNTSFDRKMLESTIEKIYDRFLDLLVNKQEADIELKIFGEDIKSIKEQYPDITELIDDSSAKIKVKKGDITNLSVRFFIDPSSTMKQDEITENQNLTSVVGFLMSLPGFAEQIAQTGKARYGALEIDFAELLKKFLINSGVDNIDRIMRMSPGDALNGATDQTSPQAMGQEIKDQSKLQEGTSPLVDSLPEDQKRLLYELIGTR